MPTVLRKRGWRFFLYPNEGHEPPHIHVQKAGMECKFWLNPGTRNIQAAYTYNLGPKDLREVRAIIDEHFDELLSAWNRLRNRQQP
jgi:hypothetical protein